jgi:hypothetical protein
MATDTSGDDTSGIDAAAAGTTDTEGVKTSSKKKRPRRGMAFVTKKRARKKAPVAEVEVPTMTRNAAPQEPQDAAPQEPQEPREPQDVSVPAVSAASVPAAPSHAAKRSHANQQVAGQPDGEYQVTETVAVMHDPARAHLPTVSSLDSAGRRMYSTVDLRARRMGVFYFDTLFGSPPESGSPPDSVDWGGRNGHVAKIRDSLLLPKTSSLRHLRSTLRVIRSYQEHKKQYKGEQVQYTVLSHS